MIERKKRKKEEKNEISLEFCGQAEDEKKNESKSEAKILHKSEIEWNERVQLQS